MTNENMYRRTLVEANQNRGSLVDLAAEAQAAGMEETVEALAGKIVNETRYINTLVKGAASLEPEEKEIIYR